MDRAARAGGARRVKEQQKRLPQSEFRNTHFSYIDGPDGVEKFVSTPELHSDDGIGGDPLPPGQVWAISPGGQDEDPGCIGSRSRGARRRSQDPEPAGTSARSARASRSANRTSTRARRSSSATAIRASTSSRFRCVRWTPTRAGRDSGRRCPVALCGSLLGRNTRGGTVVVGALNLGGSIETIPNAVTIAEARHRQASADVADAVAARRRAERAPDELWTKVKIESTKDAPDAVFKALVE